MTDPHAKDLIGSLPHTRPHRRSQKRGARPADASHAPVPAPETPAPEPPAPASATSSAGRPSRRTAKPASARPAAKPAPSRPAAKPAPSRPAAKPAPGHPAAKPAPSRSVVATAVQVAGELTEIGLTAGARALRRVVSHLPRP
jgi:2-oxoglutarate decarboxylase